MRGEHLLVICRPLATFGLEGRAAEEENSERRRRRRILGQRRRRKRGQGEGIREGRELMREKREKKRRGGKKRPSEPVTSKPASVSNIASPRSPHPLRGTEDV